MLLDMEGVLQVAWEPLPGAAQTLRWLDERRIPFLIATNATSLTRPSLAERLSAMGFPVLPDHLVTASTIGGSYLRAHHPGARCFLLGEPDVALELEGVELVDENPDVVVLAGAHPSFTWDNLSRVLRMLLDGAELVALHRNLAWMTEDGMRLDTGAFVLALEAASGVRATVTGKPAPDFFRQALEVLGVPAGRTLMVGDDIEVDIRGAQAVGIRGALVRTGKFRPEDLEATAGLPDHVVDSVAELPRLLSGDSK